MTTGLSAAIFDVLDVTANPQLEAEAVRLSIGLGCDAEGLLEICERLLASGLLYSPKAARRLAAAITAHHPLSVQPADGL